VPASTPRVVTLSRFGVATECAWRALAQRRPSGRFEHRRTCIFRQALTCGLKSLSPAIPRLILDCPCSQPTAAFAAFAQCLMLPG
jgi:hypothetical protein